MDKISTYQSIFNCTREEAIEKANKVQKNYQCIKALSKRKKEYLLSILEEYNIPEVEDIDIVLTAISIISVRDNKELTELENIINKEIKNLN